jgi:hypothetical protein
VTPQASLRTVKVLHTGVWAFFAGCIVAIPILGLARRFEAAAVFIGIVLAEGIVLVVNGLRCPLTDVAARYTDDRGDNFDIYLPLWIARNNKLFFGLWFLLGTIFVIVRWLGAV